MQLDVAPISIVIPVGPCMRHRTHLPEMIRSIEEQTMRPGEVVFVDDGSTAMGGDALPDLRVGNVRVKLVRNRWNLGVTNSMNVGVSSSAFDLSIMACADDKLLPRCVELCWRAWERSQVELGYYYLGVRYSTGQEQNVACGVAMVTRALWKYTGGFFPECAVGAGDHIWLSAMLGSQNRGVNRAQILRVSDEVLYWYRQDSNEATSRNIWPAIEAVRDKYTETWIPPGERHATT